VCAVVPGSVSRATLSDTIYGHYSASAVGDDLSSIELESATESDTRHTSDSKSMSLEQ